jgi:MFS family permease
VRRIAASVPLAVVLLDVTVVAVLVPDIRLALGSSTSGGQWVLNAYLLALAAPLPLLAALAGRASARTLAAAGALGMAAGAVVCARADSTAVLVAGQALRGAGAAALLVCVAGTLLSAARREALPAAVLPALALALGPLVGGVFAEQNWWRVFLWAGVPLAAAAAAGALAGPRPERPPHADPMRRLTFAAGLTAVTIAFVQAEAWGAWVLLAIVGVVLLRVASVHTARAAELAWAVSAGCLAALLFLAPEYFQLARNLSGLRSGALVLAITLPAVAAWALSRSLTTRSTANALAFAGLACAGIALAVLSTIDAETRYAVVIGLLGIAGTGLGVAGGAAQAMPTAESPRRLVAAALAGAAVGLATAGAAFQTAQAHERADGGSFEQALAAGVGAAVLLLLVALAGAALTVWLRRTPAEAPR